MSAIYAFSVWNIRVRVDQSWLIAFVLFSWTLSSAFFPTQAPDYSPGVYWLFGTVSTIALFACVLLHELSHCVAARKMGIPVRQITLFVFGGVSEMEQTHSSVPRAEFRTAIAGPLASIGLAALFAVLAIATRELAPTIMVETFEYLYYVNFLLAVFNLIPAFPLDGGRVLRSYLWHRSGNLRSATRIATSIGSLFAALLVGLGLFAILTFNIIPGIWLLLIGLFLKRSADSEYQAFELRSGLKDLTLQKIMSPPIAVRPSMPVSEFINDYVFRHHLRQFPVVDDGHFVGMIDVQSIKKIASAEWDEVRIGGYLLNPARYPVLNPELEAAEVLRLLVTGNHNAAPVVRDGELLGMITKDDLLRLISLKNDLAA